MRLRDVGPGIGGLNYAPLLRETNERKLRRALERLPEQSAAGARAAGAWRSIRAAARRMGKALIEARMAQAQRQIELEAARLQGRDATAFGRDIGSRYY
jgi:hypothetical protein